LEGKSNNLSFCEIESGPAALCILSSESSLWTPVQGMLMSEIDGVELCSRPVKLL